MNTVTSMLHKYLNTIQNKCMSMNTFQLYCYKKNTKCRVMNIILWHWYTNTKNANAWEQFCDTGIETQEIESHEHSSVELVYKTRNAEHEYSYLKKTGETQVYRTGIKNTKYIGMNTVMWHWYTNKRHAEAWSQLFWTFNYTRNTKNEEAWPQFNYTGL